MKLHGKRILIEKPVKPESQVILTPEAEAAMEQDLIKTWSKLKVFAVGSDCTHVQAGDMVYVGNDFPLMHDNTIYTKSTKT